MKKSVLIKSAVTVALALATGFANAADTTPMQNQVQVQTKAKNQETIYGSQLMTQQERMEYRNRMLNAKTYQEREQVRAEHHKAMQERARAKGVTLPDMPPARGNGMGSGNGAGPGGGMGPGSGMGRGRN